MDIDLSQELQYNVKLPGGKTVVLREPTDDDVALLTDIDSKEDPQKANDAFKKFIMALGMPEEDLKKIGVVRLKTLAEGIMEPLSAEKK